MRYLSMVALMGLLAVPPCPAAKEPPWFVVNPQELPSLTVPVFGVCFSGKPPRAVEKAELALPAAHPLRRTGGVIIVHTLINAKGHVVKAQILRGPADLQDAVARCLRQWRFEPAVTHDRKPAAVHFTLALSVYPAEQPLQPHLRKGFPCTDSS